MHPPFRHWDRTTARLQASAWQAWQAYSGVSPVARRALARAGYTPAHIPHLADEELLTIRDIGPDRIAELRRYLPRHGV